MQSDKLQKLPPYLFADLDAKKRAVAAKGIDIIDLSVGDPDIPTHGHIIDALCEAAKKPKNHRYPPYNGISEFREAASEYMMHKREVRLNSENEILTLIGSKEGIAHIPFVLANPGDVILVPSPGYPVYTAASILAGCVPYEMPLKKENNFLPDLSAIPKKVLSKAKVLFLNYPNNPTSAIANYDFFKEAVVFAHKNNLVICHDAAYLEIAYDNYQAPSILEVNGAKDVAIEFHSLSKTYNMTGWRLGFAAGNKEALSALGKFKANIDSSATAFVQQAGAIALTGKQSCVRETCETFQKRRDILVKALNNAGWNVKAPTATFYIWAEIPKHAKTKDSKKFALEIMEKTGVVITPGIGFGTFGEGFVRFSLTSSTERIEEAVKRISSL